MRLSLHDIKNLRSQQKVPGRKALQGSFKWGHDHGRRNEGAEEGDGRGEWGENSVLLGRGGRRLSSLDGIWSQVSTYVDFFFKADFFLAFRFLFYRIIKDC